ncbi:MAG TPA: hypothetical protein VF230_13755 [Acidimicrobiales bacterium]
MTAVIERVLVAAPYPTMPGAPAGRAFALVRSLTAEGHDVLVVSPEPSAAHAIADPGGAKGALRLASLAAGRDRLVVRLDASALAVSADPPRLFPARMALGVALWRARRAELLLDRVPAVVSTRWASLVAARAASITVATDAERDALVRAGVVADRVEVDATLAEATPAVAHRVDVAATGPATATAEAIEELIRRRAADVLGAGEGEAGGAEGPRGVSAASRPLRHLVPLERPMVQSRKPGVAYVKRVQLRLLGWMFDWVIQHVNRLQQAAIESVELADRSRR